MSCRHHEPFDKITRAATPEAFNYISPVTGRSASVIVDDASYYIVFDDDNKEATVNISNLLLPGSDRPLTLTFENVTMNYTRNNHEVERQIVEEQLTSSDPVNTGTVITDVEIVYTQANSLAPDRPDGIYARYVIDGYQVVSYPYCVYAEGTTRIDDLSDNSVSYDYNTVYRIKLDPNSMTAFVAIDEMHINNVPSSVTIDQLPLKIIDGGYEIDASDKNFNIGKGVSLCGFNAIAQLRGELKMEFDLMFNSEIRYHVAAFLSPDLDVR
ncbi:MAG: hypothetical protein NC230_06935 [Bacteroides sp.]|nr:hypothetical protein [Bacteroides sp.]